MPFDLQPHESAYRMFISKQVCDENLIYFDFFNATGSGYDIHITSIIPIVSGAADILSTVGTDLNLLRTSAIGTSGTAVGFDLAVITSSSITGMSVGAAPMPNGITARKTPTGGATPAAIIGWCSVQIDDDAAGTYIANQYNMVTLGDDGAPPVIIMPGTGISVINGSETIADGSVGFNVAFGLKAR